MRVARASTYGWIPPWWLMRREWVKEIYNYELCGNEYMIKYRFVLVLVRMCDWLTYVNIYACVWYTYMYVYVYVCLKFNCWFRLLATYRNFRLAQCRRHIQVFGYEDMSKVVSVLHAPYRQPVNVVNGQTAGQLNLDILALVATQRVQWSYLIGYLNHQILW